MKRFYENIYIHYTYGFHKEIDRPTDQIDFNMDFVGKENLQLQLSKIVRIFLKFKIISKLESL